MAAGAGAGALLLVVLLLVAICCCIKRRKAGAVTVATGRGPAKSVSVESEAEVWRPSVTSSAGRPGTAPGRHTAPLKEESYENVTYDTMERENTYGTGTNCEAGNDYEGGDYENEGAYLAQ